MIINGCSGMILQHHRLMIPARYSPIIDQHREMIPRAPRMLLDDPAVMILQEHAARLEEHGARHEEHSARWQEHGARHMERAARQQEHEGPGARLMPMLSTPPVSLRHQSATWPGVACGFAWRSPRRSRRTARSGRRKPHQRSVG